MDHALFNTEVLEKGTAAILKTRDGKLRAAVPTSLGQCTFLNDVDAKEMQAALLRHKKIMKTYPRNGEGLEAYVDASDTGYSESNEDDVRALEAAAEKAGELNDTAINGGSAPNGYTNGVKEHVINGHGKDGYIDGITNGVNGFTNGAKA